MKITLNWLKEYVDFDWSPEELAERLTMLGLEVERVEKQSGEFENVVVAQILASEKHPNADKLSVCRVADGKVERQIVCGAKNYKVGNKVPLALPGCTLPTAPGAQPFTIKVGKLRGVESQGMMCSAKELGIAEDAEGLLILPADAHVGKSFAEHLGRSSGDVIYDLEITPNRPDLNSVIGIAREVAAVTGNPLRLPSVEENASASEPTGSLVEIDLRDPELCPRYVARVIRGVKVGPSPAWLKNRLEQVGLRSINNVVDITNFVLMEIGQPLHAFDYHLLSKAAGKPAVVIRRAAESEKFTTLDGQERTLTSEMLLIADREKGIALAGIMGGQNTEINDSTTDVLLESANFKPQNIRATSKKLGLHTDSSYRFERGADIGITDWSSSRAAALIQRLAGGTILAQPLDAYPNPQPKRTIGLRPEKTNQLLGIELPVEQQRKFLESLEIRDKGTATPPEGGSPNELAFEIPAFRVDLKQEVDLIEEIARLYGVDKIHSTPPRGAIGSNVFDAVYDQIADVRATLISSGLGEAQGQTLVSDLILREMFGESAAATAVHLENPLSSEMNVLRPSLLPGLLDALQRNLHHQIANIRLFEIGRVFQLVNNSNSEEGHLAIAITGNRSASFWSGSDREAKLDIYDLKGIIEALLEHLGLRGIAFVHSSNQPSLYLESASVQLGKFSLGEFGQLNPILARKHDLRDPVLLAELNLEVLLTRANPTKSFKVLAAFPSVRRDVAMIVEDAVTHDSVLTLVKQIKPANLESTELFDIYRGKGVPEGRKSVAYAFTYRNPERTLTEQEVNAAHDKLVAEFRAKLNAAVRD
jgi:phenylalanyl-tRNA synthetase beta chain